KNQQAAAAGDNQQIVHGIDTHCGQGSSIAGRRKLNLCVGPMKNSFRRHVASGAAIKYQNRIRGDGKEDLVMDAIDGNRIERAITGADDLRMRSLNVADGRFFSVGTSAKN